MLSLERSFLLAAGFEALVYGLFFCIFGATLILQFASYDNFRSDRHGHVMTTMSMLFFAISTVHLGTNWFRVLNGFVDHNSTPGGVVAFLGRLDSWSRILTDTLYPSQENLGSAAAIYRTFILYHRCWKIVVVPTFFLVFNIVAEVVIVTLYIRANPNTMVFDHGLSNWITAFFSVNVFINILTTSLMGYRIWSTQHDSVRYNAGNGKLLTSILRIFLESAALQMIAQIILLILYTREDNGQNILLQSAVPIVGITFNVIAIRIRLHLISSTKPIIVSQTQQETIGSMRMRPFVRVHVSTTTSEIRENDEGASVSERPSRKSISLQSSPV